MYLQNYQPHEMFWRSAVAVAFVLSIYLSVDEKELANDVDGDANHKIWGRTSKQEIVAEYYRRMRWGVVGPLRQCWQSKY